MRRSLAAILALSILTAVPTVALAKRATPAAAAETRGAAIARRSEQARALVEKHFTALAAADAKAVRALWTRDARVTSIDAGGTAKRQTLSTALARWLEHADSIQWTIQRVHPITDTELEVTAQVIWNGMTFDDTLRVVVQGKTMRIRHKSSQPHAAAAEKKPSRSPY